MYNRTILAIFTMLAAFSVAFCFSGVSESTENHPVVYILPENASGKQVGEIFTVTVGANYLTGKNLYGFDIVLKWDPTSLEYVSHEVKVPVEVYSNGVLHAPIIEVKNEVDDYVGACWIAYASLSPADPFNEDGIFFTITFKVIKETDYKFTFEHIFLASQEGEVILVNVNEQFSKLTNDTINPIINEHRRLRAEMWLEWWIKVTWQMTKRRPMATGR